MKGWRTLISASSPGREETMSELFRSGGLKFSPVDSWGDFLAADDKVNIAATPLYSGAVFEKEKLVILTETELYAASPRRQRLRRVKCATSRN